MHALHFPTTFQMKMNVPYSRLYSPLPPLSFCLRFLQLRFICGWPNFQVWSIEADWQTQRHINMLAWMPLRCPFLCPPTPLWEWTHHSPPPCANPATLLCLYSSRRTHMHTVTQAASPVPPYHHLLFSLRREFEPPPMSHWFTLTRWAAKHPQRLHIFHFLTYGQERTRQIHHGRVKVKEKAWDLV